jgi:hypothetical protein
MAKCKCFEVQARLVLITSISIGADSLEDAVEQSKDLQENNFIKFKGDYLDGSYKITGVFERGAWETEQ